MAVRRPTAARDSGHRRRARRPDHPDRDRRADRRGGARCYGPVEAPPRRHGDGDAAVGVVSLSRRCRMISAKGLLRMIPVLAVAAPLAMTRPASAAEEEEAGKCKL